MGRGTCTGVRLGHRRAHQDGREGGREGRRRKGRGGRKRRGEEEGGRVGGKEEEGKGYSKCFLGIATTDCALSNFMCMYMYSGTPLNRTPLGPKFLSVIKRCP